MSKKNELPVVESPVVELSIEDQIKLANEQLKKLREQRKELKQKTEKTKKGIPVRFKNKAGETIEGLGVMYYVVNINGKLHYKEASAVEILSQEAE